MISREQFIDEVIRVARDRGYTIGRVKRTGTVQIDFGDKRLNGRHLGELWPALLVPKVDVAAQIEKVAPGLTATHEPMRQIIEQLRMERRL